MARTDVEQTTLQLKIPLNRVEGDLEVQLEIEDDVVKDAWCTGTMYRGFENMLIGRGALDGLVITPRICGICNTAHLTAAARALDAISEVCVPPDATRIRNLALAVESIQSDMRHGFLLFAPDFTNPSYRSHDLFEEAVRRYEPLRGSVAIEVIRETKRILEIVALLGGQWPHSSFMVPGGVASIPTTSDILQCRHLLMGFRRWYEDRILGCNMERWRAVQSATALDSWMEESESHRQSEIGFCIRFSRAIGIDRWGRGHGNFLSFGGLDLPEGTAVRPTGRNRAGASQGTRQLIPSGMTLGSVAQPFDQAQITEDSGHSWFKDSANGPVSHPFDGSTKPYATGSENQRYSWSKAPRYLGAPVETGPLAEMVVAGDPLFVDLVEKQGPNALVRELARLVRAAVFLPAMEVWIEELAAHEMELYRATGEIQDGEGYGLIEASRGALGHWVKIRDAKIAHYQIVTPTTWNCSPRDSGGVRGPCEEALVGTPVRDLANPVEVQHVIRSLDPCLVCTVHSVRR